MKMNGDHKKLSILIPFKGAHDLDPADFPRAASDFTDAVIRACTHAHRVPLVNQIELEKEASPTGHELELIGYAGGVRLLRFSVDTIPAEGKQQPTREDVASAALRILQSA